MRIESCEFDMNTAVYDGGAIYADWTSMFIINSTLIWT